MWVACRVCLREASGAPRLGRTQATKSFVFGALFGGIYLYLKQGEVDAFAPSSIGAANEQRRLPPALARFSME